MCFTEDPFTYQDSSSESLYNFITAVGPFAPRLDVKNEAVPDAVDNLDTEWHAIPITPTADNIFKIAVKAVKTGVPNELAEILIMGEAPGGGPEPNDTRRVIK